MPAITALARLPSLKLFSCFNKYSGCWPASLGFNAIALLPSAPWQAAHTFFAICSAPAGAAATLATFSTAKVGKLTKFNAKIKANTRRISTPNNEKKQKIN